MNVVKEEFQSFLFVLMKMHYYFLHTIIIRLGSILDWMLL